MSGYELAWNYELDMGWPEYILAGLNAFYMGGL
jgi:hypothetical protein